MITNNDDLRGMENVIHVPCRTGCSGAGCLRINIANIPIRNQPALRRGIDIQNPRNLNRVVKNF